MCKYLLIAETNNTGYFVEFHSELDKAIERASLYFDLAFHPPFDHDRLNGEFKPIGTYKVYDQFASFTKSLGGSCNGFFSTDIIEVEEDFDMKRFALLRASAQFIFSGEELEKYFDLNEKYGIENEISLWVN